MGLLGCIRKQFDLVRDINKSLLSPAGTWASRLNRVILGGGGSNNRNIRKVGSGLKQIAVAALELRERLGHWASATWAGPLLVLLRPSNWTPVAVATNGKCQHLQLTAPAPGNPTAK
jgi:hypothetical protein